MERAAQFVGAKDSRKPDNGKQQILRKVSGFIPNISKQSSLEFCSEIVTSAELLPEINWLDVASRLCPMRELRLVKSRKPKAFRPRPEQDPDYILAFVVETLECGHKLEFNFLEEAEPLTAKRRVCPQCSTTSLPKKPSQSVGSGESTNHIASRLQNLLERADAEINPDKRAAMLNCARELSRKLRTKQVGESVWWAIGFAAVCVAIFVGIAAKNEPKGYTFSAPDHYVRVIERIDDHAFVLQRVDNGIPQVKMVYHFCKDYAPLFDAGMTLSWFSYDDRGSCISIAPSDRGYVIERGSDHRPTINKFD